MTRNIFSILFLGIAVAIFFLYTSPAYDTVRSLSTQSSQYNAALDKATQLQQLKQSLLSRYNSFDPNALNRLSTMVPDQVDNIRLILDLDNIAGQYGMSLQNVDIATPSQQGTSIASSIQNAAEPYDSITLQFTTHGSYDQFTQFLTALETSLRLVDITSFTLTPSGSSGSGGEPLYSYAVGLQTYWLR